MNLGCGLNFWRRLSFGNGSALEEVVTEGSFEIGHKLAHGLSLGHSESSGCGVPDRLKLRLSRLDDVL